MTTGRGRNLISAGYRAHYANIHSKCPLIRQYLDRAPRSVKAFSPFDRRPAISPSPRPCPSRFFILSLSPFPVPLCTCISYFMQLVRAIILLLLLGIYMCLQISRSYLQIHVCVHQGTILSDILIIYRYLYLRFHPQRLSCYAFTPELFVAFGRKLPLQDQIVAEGCGNFVRSSSSESNERDEAFFFFS